MVVAVYFNLKCAAVAVLIGSTHKPKGDSGRIGCWATKEKSSPTLGVDGSCYLFDVCKVRMNIIFTLEPMMLRLLLLVAGYLFLE
jgi:hypothetical protein